MSTTEPALVEERRGNVLLLRLNRPDARNALTFELMGALGEAVRRAETDPELRAVVVTGTGDRAFCAGMDLRSFTNSSGGPPSEADLAPYLRILEGDVKIPVIGAANADALAGGFELLLGCDVIVASAAAHFGLPEVKRGLFAGNGVMHIGRRLPLGVALELGLTGDPIDASRAYDLGLVNVLVPPDEVVQSALAVAGRIAANGPLGVAATKELVRAAAANAPQVRDRLHELQGQVFSSEDAQEGSRAFLEKRAPEWRGR